MGTNRRRFLATLGAAATGTSAAVGTGAFTSVSADRSVNVQVADDSNAFLGLVPGDTGLVTESGGTLQINLDGTGTPAKGVNFNAVTQLGSHGNPEDDHAFKIVNQGTQSVMLQMSYYFTDTSWLDNGTGQSFINFTLYDTSGITGHNSENYPRQNGNNKVFPVGMPTGSNKGSNDGNFRFNVGEEYYMVITVDTTGPDASPDDDLSGVAEFFAGQETDRSGYEPEDPPI